MKAQAKTTQRLASVIGRLAGNTLFSVRFQKRTTGEMRDMVCRLHVRKGVKGDEGKGPAYDPKEKGLLAVYDVQVDGWRSIPLDAIERIKIRGVEYDLQKKQQEP